ncbi:MAG: hypothetical protein IM638_15755 [Bacteroidetes bacterium]|nr:hypothetical protein [Bacteroidota bacterium]
MKKYFLFVFLFQVAVLKAQRNVIYVHVNEAHSGLHAGVDWRYHASEKWIMYGGLHYLVNRIVTDNQQYVYKHRFYANNFGQHLGIRLGSERQFSLKQTCVKPFVFIQVQQTRSALRTFYAPDLIVNSLELIEGAGLNIPLHRVFDVRLAVALSNPFIYSERLGTSWDGFSVYTEAGVTLRIGRNETQ